MSTTSPGTPVIFGEVLFDRFDDGSVVLGGAPFNVAWNLQALGLAPLLVSRVGRDDLGDRILAAMENWGLDPAGLQFDDEHPTGTVEVTVEDGEPSFDIAQDKAYDFIAASEIPRRNQSGILYHGSLALRNEPSRSTLEQLSGSGAGPVLMDVNLRDPWWSREPVLGLLNEAAWAKLNENELAALVPEAPDLHGRADHLMENCGLECLVVTRGADGAWAQGKEGWTLDTGPVVASAVLDTVGAGDAFSSVVILGLTHGWPWPLILERAQSFAAAVVGLRGATSEDRKFYEPFVESWMVR